MSDLGPPWGNATSGRGDDVTVHVKAKPHRTIAVVPSSTGAAKLGLARLIQAAPDLYKAAREILERHGAPWDDGVNRCPCEDCAALEYAIARAEGEIT